MRFNPKARIDNGGVSDAGGSGGGGLGGGGPRMRLPIPGGSKAGGGIGGVVILLLFLVIAMCTGGGIPGLPSDGGGGTSSNNTQAQDQQANDSGDGRYDECKTGEDANKSADCTRVAVVSSIQDYWTKTLPEQTNQDYARAKTITFTGQVNTGCGAASSQVGPFYCPRDSTVYLDSGFFDQVLEQQLGGPDGGFVEAYVIGHEYGHHIQNLMGTMGKVRTQQGPESDAVRLELQADCYAGMWTKGAAETTDSEGNKLFLEPPNDEDIKLAIEAAEAVGDDRIQEKTSGRVNPEAWTHGSAEQRQRWFKIGLDKGDYKACDTFSANRL